MKNLQVLSAERIYSKAQEGIFHDVSLDGARNDTYYGYRWLFLFATGVHEKAVATERKR